MSHYSQAVDMLGHLNTPEGQATVHAILAVADAIRDLAGKTATITINLGAVADAAVGPDDGDPELSGLCPWCGYPLNGRGECDRPHASICAP